MLNIRKILRGEIHYGVLLNFLSKLKGNFNLLEVGAQGQNIKKYIPKNISYSSLDIEGDSDYKIDLNKQKIPVKDNTFDILVCLETLEHTLYPRKILKELKRVTKKDGFFVLSMPNDYNLWLRLRYLLGIKSNMIEEPFEIVSKLQHIHRPRVKDILNLFSENFRIIKIVPIWQSRIGANNSLFYGIDLLIGLLAKIYPSLFSRLIVVIARNKEHRISS